MLGAAPQFPDFSVPKLVFLKPTDIDNRARLFHPSWPWPQIVRSHPFPLSIVAMTVDESTNTAAVDKPSHEHVPVVDSASSASEHDGSTEKDLKQKPGEGLPVEPIRTISRVPGNPNYYEKGGLRTYGDGEEHDVDPKVSTLPDFDWAEQLTRKR